MSSKIKLQQGQSVCHIDNLGLKMRVRSIVFKDNKLMHIVCSWFQDNKMQKDKFHSKELVPYEIAEKGIDVVNAYLKSIEDEKKFDKYLEDAEK